MKAYIKKAVEILQQGGLVALPTETVYGLAADANNPQAVKKIFLAKGRPADHPLIVHIASISQLADWAIDISDSARLLAKTFWPGPLTLIFKKASSVNNIITGGQDTIGIRIPNHPITLEVLKTWGGSVAAPSANRFGRISPTTAQAVSEELGDSVDFILDGGQCEVGVESTIVDVSSEEIRILRPGMITAQQIEMVLQKHLSQQKKNTPRVSGSLASHYAPQTPLKIVSREEIIKFLAKNTLRVKVLAYEYLPSSIKMPDSPQEYAHDLYSTLRELDKQKWDLLLVQAVPETADWDAIRDRLQRASCHPEADGSPQI